MSDEYTIAGNFQRSSDDPRAEAEYWYRMGRVREREADVSFRCRICGMDTTDPEHNPAICEAVAPRVRDANVTHEGRDAAS